MSKQSIYANSWINLVFEGRNKDYGAFALRQKSDETTLLAFCLGLFFVATLISIPLFIARFSESNALPSIDTIIDVPVTLVHFKPNKPQIPVKTVVPITKKKPDEAEKKQPLIDPEITKAKDANYTATDNKQPEKSNPEGTETKGSSTPTTPNPTTDNGKSIIPENKSGDNPSPTYALDKLPEYPGGITKFYEYVGDNFEKLEVDETISVIMSFVIEKDGSMTDIKVLRSSSPTIDNEAIRVLKSLRTKWKPGIKDGHAVRTEYKLQIKVKK